MSSWLVISAGSDSLRKLDHRRKSPRREGFGRHGIRGGGDLCRRQRLTRLWTALQDPLGKGFLRHAGEGEFPVPTPLLDCRGQGFKAALRPNRSTYREEASSRLH